MPSSYSFTYLPDAQEEGPERLDAASSRSKKMRIDKFLAQSLPEHSRSYIQNLLRQGYVIVNGDIVTDANDKLLSGTTVTITLPDAEDPAPQPENIPLDILYEDDDIVVVDKPAGITVHPGAGQRHGTLVNALLYHCGASLSGINGVKRPGIVHRLDKGTSGLLVVAKNNQAHQGLAQQFLQNEAGERTIKRTYDALVWGVPAPLHGMITGNIGRDPHHRLRMSLHAHGGKSATTHYRTMSTFGRIAARLECKLETGRTHQIRVHLAHQHQGHVYHNLLLDPLYGRTPRSTPGALREFLRQLTGDGEKLLLHAKKLSFLHPTSGRKIRFHSPTPQILESAIAYLEKNI